MLNQDRQSGMQVKESYPERQGKRDNYDWPTKRQAKQRQYKKVI